MRLNTFRGAVDAIEAAAILRARYGDKNPGDDVRQPEVRAAELDHLAAVSFSRPTPVVLQQSDHLCLAFPLRGLGPAGVEAMACGAALVTADNGGSRDCAIDGETALVVLPRQPDQIAAAVIRLIEDEALQLRIAGDG